MVFFAVIMFYWWGRTLGWAIFRLADHWQQKKWVLPLPEENNE